MQQKSKAFSTYCSPICSHYTRQAPRNLNNILSLYSKYYPPLLNVFLSDTECTSLYFFIYLNPKKRPFSFSNLFNAIPRKSPLRHLVYQSLLATATAHDDIEVLQLTKESVEKWISDWEISADEKAAFLKSIVDAYAKADQL